MYIAGNAFSAVVHQIIAICSFCLCNLAITVMTVIWRVNVHSMYCKMYIYKPLPGRVREVYVGIRKVWWSTLLHPIVHIGINRRAISYVKSLGLF
jgi:uncharacterized membrane protein